MKILFACTLALCLSSARVLAQTEGGALAQLLRQSGRDEAPPVSAVAVAVEAGASGAKLELLRFAKCTGAIPYGSVMVPVTLDFYKEHQAGHPETPTGKGTMNLMFADGPAVPHSLRIIADDERGTRLELYTAFDAQRKFAEFSIPGTKKSRVSIHAIEFHAEWVSVECVR